MSARRWLVVALVGASLLWLLSDGDSAPRVTEPSSGAARFREGAPPKSGGSRAASAGPEFEGPTPDVTQVVETAMIRDVRFEPPQPCAGDPVRVFTDLRAEATDAKVFVNGEPGSPQVVYADAAGRQPVRVLVRGWDETFERRELTLPVQPCTDRPARLSARVVATRVAERSYAFRLEPTPEGAIRWDFGDGASAEGTTPTHRYASRADRSHSTYLVHAHYDGPNGPEETFVAVSHVEAVGIAARTAHPVLENEGQRFVDWDSGQGLRTTRFVTNALDVPIDFEVAEVRAFGCDGSDAQVVHLPASEVLDLTHVRAGESVDLSVNVPAHPFEGAICQMHVELGGPAGPRLATSAFSLDTGVPDERTPIEDSELLHAIQAIVAERGPGRVTTEEIAAYRAANGS